jgi:hypothetical protein
MNSNPSNQSWNRLVAGARRASDERDASAPYGFATRVAALALSQESRMVSLVERFALRALGVACLLALVSVAANYSALTTPALGAEEESFVDDPVAALLDA